jgi:autotransporter adhesin
MSKLRDLERRSLAGIAMSVALASAKAPLLEPGDKAFGAGVGYYAGQTALAITLQALDSTGKVSYNVGVSSNTRQWTLGAGFGFRWK